MEWKAARSSVARLLRTSWYNKAAEREQQELPKEAVEVNSTREPEASVPAMEAGALCGGVSETQELPNEPVDVNPTSWTNHPQSAHGQEDSQNGRTPEPPAVRRTWKCVRRGGMDVRRFPQISRQHAVGYLHNNEVFEVVEERLFQDASEGVFLRLANSQGWVFSQSRSGTFASMSMTLGHRGMLKTVRTRKRQTTRATGAGGSGRRNPVEVGRRQTRGSTVTCRMGHGRSLEEGFH